MGDPRFYDTAKRMDHVYLDRLMFQGLEIRPPKLNGNPIANMSRIELIKSAMLAPMDPRDFLNEFFAD